VLHYQRDARIRLGRRAGRLLCFWSMGMATLEERAHARELLTAYQRRLRVREKQLSRAGDSVDPAIVLDIEELRVNITALEPLVQPEPSQEVKEVIRQHVDDAVFVFVQLAKFGERLTHVEEQAQTASEQATAAAQQQQAAQLWRLDITANMEALKTDQEQRKPGQRRNFWLQLLGIVLNIVVACVLIGAIVYLVLR
jgi:hypothetical protein